MPHREPCTREEATARLRGEGIQPTAQRVEVLHQMHAFGGHVSADDLHLRLNASGSRVSRATVYNTLQVLVAAGLVREVVVEPGRVLFDANVAPHHHFFNEQTLELQDIPHDQVGFVCLPLAPEGTRVVGVDVVVRVRPDH